MPNPGGGAVQNPDGSGQLARTMLTGHVFRTETEIAARS